ncbi:ATP-binding cassette domain-containing protein [Actinoplanes sp. HUAS TT8]|uniref:ATP-binding cassette domain-containing protein n=1 Tax=Actinoplanes sp. HUAS TT8 TaxID=3447453 RepID=UPI003F523D1D
MIDVRGLRKSFGTGENAVAAVRGVDLEVKSGEIFGFLGPNGAGKTTTMRILATLLPPDDGSVFVAGADLRRRPDVVRRHLGYVAQGGSTWYEVTAREELVMQARLHGHSRAEAQRRARTEIAAFELDDFADRRCKTYSGGQRRRVDVALGVIHRPALLVLDEPTTGLDPQSRARMWDEIRRLRDEGMTVFLSTHYLEEADALCDRIAIIDHGRIVCEGSPEALRREVSGDVVTIGLDGSPEPAVRALRAEPYVHRIDPPDPDGLRVHVHSETNVVLRIVRALDHAGVEPRSVDLRRPSLDDVFLARTGRKLRES